MQDDQASVSPGIGPAILEALGGALVGLCLLGPDGEVLEANAEWLRIAGLTSGSAVGKRIGELPLSPPDLRLLHGRARAGQIVHIPARERLVDGRRICSEGRLAPVRLPIGMGVLAVEMEVTLPGSAGEAEALHRTLFTSAPSAMVMLDEDGRILAFSDQAPRQLGYSREAFAGLRLADLVPDLEADALRARLTAIFDSDGAEFEARHRTRSGEFRDVLVRSRTVEVGGRRRLVSVWEDVTERKRIEQQLHREQAFLRQVIDADTTVILVKDLENRFVLANQAAARHFGTTLEKLIGRRDRDFIPLDGGGRLPPEYDALYAAERDAMRTRTVVHDDVALTGADGKVRWFSSVRIPLVAEDGSCDLLLVVASDVTERKRMEEALRQSDRRKSDFLAVLSHELRNPLAPIRNSLYLLERAPPGSAQADRARMVIQRQTEHLIRLVDDLLDVTRIEHGKVRLQRERLDLSALVRRVAEDHGEMFEGNGIAFAVEIEERLHVNGDAVRLAQVMGNLLWNAAKFTPPGGSSTLRLRRVDERFAEITVRDTGEGIPPEVRARLFQPFVQAEQTLHRSRGGLGLGLALVKGLAELHGGTVSADSAGPGGGATFCVRLPIERRETARTALEPGRAAEAHARRVLVIEDNVDAADTLRDVLELHGHQVEVAHSGPDGLARARAFRPDVVLCDIGLPGMDGYQVARVLRDDPELRSAGRVALTGYGHPEDVDASIAAGFDAHVTKPPRVEELEESMEDAHAAGALRRGA